MLKKMTKYILSRFGYKIVNTNFIPSDIRDEKEFISTYEKCKKYSLLSIERLYSLYQAIEYVVKHKVPGDVVECGVWKGGSAMMMAFTLLKMRETERKIYLYDTYAGMSEPTNEDVNQEGMRAHEKWINTQEKDFNRWVYSPIEEVRTNLFSAGYPQEKLIFVKGKVEDTIPNTIPDKISVLHLDTDWFKSTNHELQYLFPKLSVNGIIMIDDYGHWQGAREAVDKYIRENNVPLLLNRVDYTGRIGIKVNI